MYKKMLKELIEILKENNIDIYFNIKEEELKKLVEDTLINYKLENDYDFYYVSNMVIKKIFGIYDSHTKVVFKNALHQFVLECFEDRLQVLLQYT